MSEKKNIAGGNWGEVIALVCMIALLAVIFVMFMLTNRDTGDDSGSGSIIRYLDDRVAMVAIRIGNEGAEAETEANKLLEVSKKIIERKGNKIIATVPLKPIKDITDKGVTIREYVVIFQLTEPNTPS